MSGHSKWSTIAVWGKVFLGVSIVLFFTGLSFWLTGCGSAVSTTTTNATTTSTTTTSTATTTAASTTTTSTTTTTVLGISGTLTNCGGSESEIRVMAFKDTVFTGDVTSSVVVVSDSQATYEISVAVAGNYYVVAWDFDFGVVSPEAGDYVGAYGWTGTDSLEADGDSQALNMAIVQNATSIEVGSIATANFTMHEVVVGSGITVSASTTYPSTVTLEATLRAMLFKTSNITSSSDFTEFTNIYKMSQSENVSPGDDVGFSFANVGANSYYCLVFPIIDDRATHAGAYGWTGTSEVSGDDLFDDSGDLWQNKVSFEVSTSAVSLGAISLHLLQL